MRRWALALVAASLAVSALAGCGPDPKEQYAEQASAIVTRWQAVAAEWNAKPGDPKARADLEDLAAEAKALEYPSEMKAIHALLISAMETEIKSLEAYEDGAKQEAGVLNRIALDTMAKYKKALQNLGLVK